MTGVVIVGSSIGGVRTAQSLRSNGYPGSITLVGEEHALPYDKPPLSKGFLRGDTSAAANTLLTEEAAAAEGIELRLGARARSLDPQASTIELSSGSTLGYEHLVIATGCSARTPPWGDQDGIHVLRTVADATALRDNLTNAESVVIIGAGFVGAEVAATLRQLDIDVTLVDTCPLPMQRALDPLVGEWFRDHHRDQGVHLALDSGVVAIEGSKGAFSVVLGDGRRVSASLVVAGLGADPNTQWLENSGLRLDDGVVTDEYCRSTQSNVYAIGDVARWYSADQGAHVRLEHWTNAVDQAACVAHNLTNPGDQRPYTPVPYVWTDQYTWKSQVIGYGTGKHRWVVGGPSDGRAVVLYGDDDGVFVGAVTLNWPRALVRCRRAAVQKSAVSEMAAALTETLAGSATGTGDQDKSKGIRRPDSASDHQMGRA